MHTFNVIALSAAACAFLTQASPMEPKGGSYVMSAPAEVSCGNDQVISCCNTKTSTTNNGSAEGLVGIAGNVLDGVLGGSCTPLAVVGIPINKACGNNVAACCTGDQEGGLLNLQCNNLNVL
ncbi:uncharacterized protein Z518_09516 [Rhinocladiella mackenziei CBS 650.93]|uniref:Hydrophobin n=1 Tax=Rhinocladiella mackenziei CBS 650.93 TaxID=1442369 RepID=A0A0D2I7G5_9EURO|nr:uncharacterized protein Z518_09516 [Rhinocladiella mackenziei CBS 650.93]KIX01789.1 hypothetical protein Z518_09516 [Rhinocladiella mackenziei CBS 650.93]